VTLWWERGRNIVKIEDLWRTEAMMLHEHVFPGRAQGTHQQGVCSTEIAREAAKNKSTALQVLLL